MNTRTKKIVVMILILMGILILLPIINELKPTPSYNYPYDCCWDTTYTQLTPTTYIPPEVLFVAAFGLVVLISLLISYLMTYCDSTEECTCPICGHKHLKKKEEK